MPTDMPGAGGGCRRCGSGSNKKSGSCCVRMLADRYETPKYTNPRILESRKDTILGIVWWSYRQFYIKLTWPYEKKQISVQLVRRLFSIIRTTLRIESVRKRAAAVAWRFRGVVLRVFLPLFIKILQCDALRESPTNFLVWPWFFLSIFRLGSCGVSELFLVKTLVKHFFLNIVSLSYKIM